MSYTWEGMKKITKDEAIERFKEGLEVYRLYDDGTEGLCENLNDIMDPAFDDYDFGYEKGVPAEAYCGQPTAIQEQAIAEIHTWDRDMMIMELEAFISTMTDEQIKQTILKKETE